jgi:hypothetical protein
MKKRKNKYITTVDNKNSNKINNIIDPGIEEVVTNVIDQKKGGRKQKFHLYRMFNLPVKTYAILAGYNKDYGYKLVEEYRNTPKIRHTIEQIINDMPEAYRSVCKMRLLQISEIEGAALREYQDIPQKAIDKPQLLKQIKQGAGVLADDDKPAITYINIKKLQALMASYS